VGVRVKQRKGAWWVYVDHKRQRKAKRVGIGQAGKRAAEEVAKAYEVQLTLGTFDFSKPASMTLLAYSGDWLNTHGLTLKLGTREKHAEVLRVHWLPTLGPVVLASMTRQQVKSIVADKARTYARGTVSYMTDVLRSCLHSAVEDGIIPVNPAARLGALATKGRKAAP
jgi:integrase